MNTRSIDATPVVWARVAGALYLVIIVCGLFGEIGVRSALVVQGDPSATARNILAADGLYRAGFVADTLMFLSDGVLAVLLFLILRPVHRVLALVALCFRLLQSAVIAVNLLNYHAALLVLEGGDRLALGASERASLASLFLDLHSHGYDLGLIPFGIHCLLLGYLIAVSGYLPKMLGYLSVAAGVTYLIGSYTRFLLPNLVEAVSPIYLVAIVSELSLCLWLLVKGVDAVRWNQAAVRN